MTLRRLTLPADKANHVIWGFVAALGAAWLSAAAGYPQHAGLTGALAAVAVGLLKELADYLANVEARAARRPERHTLDPLDAVATAAGGLAVWAVCAVVGG